MLIAFHPLLVYKEKNEARELHLYQSTYGHVVHKYETLRRSKLWNIAKKVKRKLKGK